MVPWRRLVACYSCFMLQCVCVGFHFAAMCDNLHRAVIPPPPPQAFCGIQVISESCCQFMMLNRYTGFCWFITMESVILDYRSKVEDTWGPFQYPIKRVIVRSNKMYIINQGHPTYVHDQALWSEFKSRSYMVATCSNKVRNTEKLTNINIKILKIFVSNISPSRVLTTAVTSLC